VNVSLGTATSLVDTGQHQAHVFLVISATLPITSLIEPHLESLVSAVPMPWGQYVCSPLKNYNKWG
jgi:hypothetical protein